MPNTRKNKDFNPYGCPVTHCMNKIGGKWKILILYAIYKNCDRLSKLQKALPVISKQMLINQLRELEEDHLLERIVYEESRLRVEYKLTPLGLTLMPIIKVMNDWGAIDMKKPE